MGNIGKAFSVENDILTLDGARVGGYADGVYMVFSYDDTSAKEVEGSDGETAVKFNSKKKGTLKITLLQTSDSNTVLSTLYQSIGRSGFMQMAFKDMSGVSTAFGTAFFTKIPDMTRALEPQNVEWELRIIGLEMIVGGN